MGEAKEALHRHESTTPPPPPKVRSVSNESKRDEDASREGSAEEPRRRGPIDIDQVVKYRGRQALSPYGMSTLSPAYSLVDMAAEIERADTSIGTVVSSKLEVIATQIRMLQKQAEEVLAKARGDLDLHRARCSFSRRMGHVYHLYLHDEGHLYWSMLSPEDWKQGPPHEYRGSYRLESDQSWTPAEEIPSRDADPTRFERDDVVSRLLATMPSRREDPRALEDEIIDGETT